MPMAPQPTAKPSVQPTPNPDHPVADGRGRHRNPCIVQPAQRAGADGLHAVDDLEGGSDVEQARRQCQHFGRAGHAPVQEQAGQKAGNSAISRLMADMNATPIAQGGKTGPAHPGRISAAERLADPHASRRLADPHRHHEGDGGDLDRDVMRGDGCGVDPAHHDDGE